MGKESGTLIYWSFASPPIIALVGSTQWCSIRSSHTKTLAPIQQWQKLEYPEEKPQQRNSLSINLLQEVDVTTEAPIPAFCSSDEEDEDKEALLYLPIAPEIEDPEDNWVPVSLWYCLR